MKVLPDVEATPEQLPVLTHPTTGLLIIRGAAGSGKTTTALLRLKLVLRFWSNQLGRQGRPVNVLVLTYNRTLRGYINELARVQVAADLNVKMEVATFASWAVRRTGVSNLLKDGPRDQKIVALGAGLGLEDKFLIDEVHYACGRFLPQNLSSYLTTRRDGRGTSPQVPRQLRERLLREVIEPYSKWKQDCALLDWNDVAVRLAGQSFDPRYEVVIVDETQDFEANRVRAVLNQMASPSSLNFVLDGAQRIYPHYFTWSEVGLQANSATVKVLRRNYRNTKQIAAFAAPFVDGLDLGPDASIPDLTVCDRTGPKPVVIKGKYSKQASWAVNYIKKKVDLNTDSVAFLKPKGRKRFDEIRKHLARAGLEYETLTRERDWPTSATNIALCTMHSAKGLEFDHVVILGLNQDVTEHGDEPGDVDLEGLRRLLAMSICRARKSVVLGYKPEEASSLVGHLKPGTFDEVEL